MHLKIRVNDAVFVGERRDGEAKAILFCVKRPPIIDFKPVHHHDVQEGAGEERAEGIATVFEIGLQELGILKLIFSFAFPP